jgi:hypothetical protein
VLSFVCFAEASMQRQAPCRKGISMSRSIDLDASLSCSASSPTKTAASASAATARVGEEAFMSFFFAGAWATCSGRRRAVGAFPCLARV